MLNPTYVNDAPQESLRNSESENENAFKMAAQDSICVRFEVEYRVMDDDTHKKYQSISPYTFVTDFEVRDFKVK